MSITKSSLFSELKGSLGNIIIYEVDGQIRLRSKPGSYRDCKSEEQLKQRNRLKGAAGFYRFLDYPLYLAWKQMTKGTRMSAYNLFIKTNLLNFTAEGKPADFKELQVCTGKLPSSKDITAQVASDGEVVLQWQYNPANKESGEDRIRIVLYEPEKKKNPRIYLWDITEVKRKAGHCRFKLPDCESGKLHFYVTFWEKYTLECSGSTYGGFWAKN